MHTQRGVIMLMTILLSAMGTSCGETTTPGDPTATTGAEDSATGASDQPVLLFIQGRLKPGAEGVYQQYVKGTWPLMAEYGVTVEAVGTGFGSEYTTDDWPVNAILKFPDQVTAEAFLADPRYIEIKEKYRDQAYETLHLSFVQTRPPRVRTPKQVAEEAFEDFSRGLATGEWEPFLDRLSDDFTFHFPLGKYQGLNEGKDRATEFFTFVSQAYPEGLEIEEVVGVTAEGNRVVFEFFDRGLLRGQPYHNLVTISLDVCGEEICAYREYFGLVGPPPSSGGEG